MTGRTTARLTLSLLVPALLLAAPLRASHAGEQAFIQWLPSQITFLDPAKSTRIQDDQVMWLIYDALTQLSADGTEMLPALAERWEKSADGLTYTFTLRKDVRFHDGSIVDAEAVKVSYERQFLKGSPFYSTQPLNAYEQVLSGFIKEVHVLDSHRLSITTHYPRPQQFAIVKVVSPQALAKHGGSLSRTPIGTGPFQLERWEDNQITLKRFAGSWHGRAKIPEVRYVVLGDNSEAIERLGAGEFDLMLYLSPDFLEQLTTNPRVDLVKFGGLNTMFVGMQLDRPALKARRLREAVVRAVNRDRLASVLGRGAMIIARGPLPPSCAGFDSAAAQPSYDIERARALLKGRGGPTAPLRLRLLFFDPLELWAEIAHAVQADLAKAGATVELLRVPGWKEFHQERQKGNHDLYLYNWSVSTPDPERFLYPLFHSQSKDNFGGFADARVDKLLAEARQPMDEARRLQLYGEVTRQVLEQIPALFLVHRIGIAGVSSRVKGLTLNLYGLPQDKLAQIEIR